MPTSIGEEVTEIEHWMTFVYHNIMYITKLLCLIGANPGAPLTAETRCGHVWVSHLRSYDLKIPVSTKLMG